MQHRTIVDAIETPQGYVVRWPGGLVETIPGERFLQMFPHPIEPTPSNRAEPKVVVGVTPVQPQVQDDPPVVDEHGEDRVTKICIECGASVRKVMPSGKCWNCATVRCPTCGQPARAADMAGQYCPACLGGRKPRGG